MKMRWQTITSSVSIRTISPTATPLPEAYGCVALYIAGRRTNLVVYGWRPKPIRYHNKKSWLSEGLKVSIKHKNKLYHKNLKCKTAYNEIMYKTYRNKLKHILAKAEKKIIMQIY